MRNKEEDLKFQKEEEMRDFINFLIDKEVFEDLWDEFQKDRK